MSDWIDVMDRLLEPKDKVMSEWISVEDRLPAKAMPVLV